MGVPARIREAFDSYAPLSTALRESVAQTLGAYCERQGYAFLRPRVKPVESVSEKLESGRFARWSHLDDLVACTVIVPTASHDTDVLTFLDAVYDTVDIRLRNSTQKAPDVFRFDTTRYIGRIRLHEGLELPAGIEKVLFEVQVPTAFEHAWAVVTHDLVYKAGDFDWRKHRLAAQLRAAVEQLDQTIAAFGLHAGGIVASRHAETDLKSRTIDRCKALVELGVIAPQLVPQSWSRLADNLVGLARDAGGSRQMVDNVSNLFAAVEFKLLNEPQVTAGSLFQVFLAEAFRRGWPTKMRDLVIIDSPELHDIHGVGGVPNPFTFD